MPNGVKTEYGYDAASQLQTLTYKRGATTLGNLTYDYDTLGRRTRMGGSFARNLAPEPMSAPVYNNVNQLTQRGAATFTYDDNGNLTSDGANTYTWNTRNQLAAISGTVAANFSYDSFGRRISKTVNGQTTSYLYDGSNVVREQVGSTNINLLNGGLDEVFTRSEGSSTWSPLRDGLGSTLALADGAGSVQSEYAYGAFGGTTNTGANNSNASQYTARENDATGLYYNRARYYSPTLQRFISEDPIGMAGGINLYAYADNNPISFSDPLGLDPVEIIIWNSSPLSLTGFGGHVSYVIDGHMWSWEGHGWASQGNEPLAQDYIHLNQQYRSGMGYVIDFGSDAKNEAFKKAIMNGYDGASPSIGFPYPSSDYNLFTNNCGNAFCAAINSGNFGLPPNNSWTPWGNRMYIETYLGPLIRSRNFYPAMAGRSCAEYTAPPGGFNGFFNRLAQDIGNLYGYH